MRFPSLFVTHGAPSLALEPGPAHTFLQGLGKRLGKPRAILCISAHWETEVPQVSGAEHPPTIHDFGGFEPALHQIRYPTPGAPALASDVRRLLRQAGMPVSLHPARGLDHGAWVPLLLMYPEADVPVTQLSVQTGTRHHLRMGEALRPLREEGVLILASGSATHNLFELGRQAGELEPPAWVTDFDHWLERAIREGRTDDLIHYRERAPFAARNHPTEEHLLPLFVALGASQGGRGQRVHTSHTYGILSMAAFVFA